MSQISVIDADPSDPGQMRALAELVQKQAEWHQIETLPDPKKLSAELSGDNPVGRVLILLKDGEPRGYLLYNSGFHFADGELETMIYMEDLYCPGIRIEGGEIKTGGQKLMEALCTKFPGVSYIEWVAADDNPVAHKFYTRIESVVKSDEGVYDLSAILKTSKAGTHHFNTVLATRDDLDFLNNQLGNISGLENALQAEHTKVLYVTNEDGQAVLALFANKNFSSFRNVTGFETVQPAYVPGHPEETYQAGLKTGFTGLAEYARTENLNGHLFACFSIKDKNGQKFLAHNNHDYLLMRDAEPASRLRKITWPHPVRRELTEKWVAAPGDSFSISM